MDGKSEYAAEATDYQAAHDSFIRMCTIRNLSEQSKSYYKNTLSVLFRLLRNDGYARPIDVTKEAIENAMLTKQKEVSDISVNMYLRSWRSFLNFLYDEGFLPSNPTENLRLIKTEKRIIQTFSKQQIKKLLDQPNKSTFTGYRDYTLMLLLLDTGVRVHEAENIKITDIHWKERVIKVMGKGRKERFVPFQRTLEQHLKEYIAVRGPLEHDYLFINIDNQKLSKRSIQEKIREYGKEANIRDVRVGDRKMRLLGAVVRRP